MDRETKTIETPIGKQKVEIKTWLTGREKRAITSLFLGNASIGDQGKGNINLSADIVNQAQDESFKSVIVSIDGKKENIVNSILDMRGEDYDFVVAEINKITSGAGEEDVKKN